MAELERAFITETGTVWKKVTGKDGVTYHFRDGTPKTKHAFKSVPTSAIAQEGQNPKIAVPSDTGPGYERKEVDRQTGSAVGQRLANTQAGNPLVSDVVTIDGETYEVDNLVDLNNRIIDRHGTDAVVKY